MESYGTPGYTQRMAGKIQIFFEEIWPSVYTLVNDFLYGIINFIKFLFRGIFPGS